jgi:hypothetical protein
VSSIPGATSYIWTLPAGATGTSTTNSITVAFSSTYVTGNICVRAANSCVQSASFCRSVIYYSARPGTPVAIIGSTAGACGDTRTYSVANVANTSSYNWTAPANSTIVSGQGTNTVSVQFLPGFTTGSLSVTASNCVGASTARTLALSNATATPASIAGTLYGNCAGSARTFSCPAVSGATVYTWTVPANAIINSGQGTNSVTILWASTGLGNISVIETTAEGCVGTTLSQDVVVIPTNVEELSNELILYPNPATTELNLQTTSELIGSDLFVFDALGKQILKQQILSTNTRINTSAFAVGNYVVKVGGGVKKFTVEK